MYNNFNRMAYMFPAYSASHDAEAVLLILHTCYTTVMLLITKVGNKS